MLRVSLTGGIYSTLAPACPGVPTTVTFVLSITQFAAILSGWVAFVPSLWSKMYLLPVMRDKEGFCTPSITKMLFLMSYVNWEKETIKAIMF